MSGNGMDAQSEMLQLLLLSPSECASCKMLPTAQRHQHSDPLYDCLRTIEQHNLARLLRAQTSKGIAPVAIIVLVKAHARNVRSFRRIPLSKIIAGRIIAMQERMEYIIRIPWLFECSFFIFTIISMVKAFNPAIALSLSAPKLLSVRVHNAAVIGFWQ